MLTKENKEKKNTYLSLCRGIKPLCRPKVTHRNLNWAVWNILASRFTLSPGSREQRVESWRRVFEMEGGEVPLEAIEDFLLRIFREDWGEMRVEGSTICRGYRSPTECLWVSHSTPLHLPGSSRKARVLERSNCWEKSQPTVFAAELKPGFHITSCLARCRLYDFCL